MGKLGQETKNPWLLTAANIEKSVKLAASGRMVVNDGFVDIWVISRTTLGILCALVFGVRSERLFERRRWSRFCHGRWWQCGQQELRCTR